MCREELHKQFVGRFSAPALEQIEPVALVELVAVEGELKITFPASYVSFITGYGPIFTPDVSDAVGDCEVCVPPEEEVFAVREFLSLSQMVRDYRACVEGGMPNWLIPFAVDIGGHLFGFKRGVKHPRPDDSAVLVFDNDYCEIRTEVDSFDGWLDYYLSLRK